MPRLRLCAGGRHSPFIWLLNLIITDLPENEKQFHQIFLESLLTSAKIAATDYEGMGFAIPSATVKDVIDDIMKYGYVQGRVKIGVTGENVQSSGNTPAGIAIYSIDEDGPCANTDLKENDIITGADGKKVSNFAEFYDILESHKAGDTIELEYYRSSNGSTDKVTITLQESK